MSIMSYEDAVDDGYSGPPPRRNGGGCGGYANYSGHCGALDCCTCHPGGYDEEPEDQEASTAKIVTARKARPAGPFGRDIRVGDRVLVESGFTFIPEGARTGYFRRYSRISKGPAWPVENSTPWGGGVVAVA